VLLDSGTAVNKINSTVFNKLQTFFKRCKSFISQFDNKKFAITFIKCKKFLHEAIIRANFLKENWVLFDNTNARFIYPTDLPPPKPKKEDTAMNSKPKFALYFSSRMKLNVKDKLRESVKLG